MAHFPMLSSYYFSKHFSRASPFYAEGAKGIVRVSDRQDLVVITRMYIFEVHVNNGSSVFSVFFEKCHIRGTIVYVSVEESSKKVL